ncbi:hypothetical protein LOD99_2986 [Oopsacas minuta]|uniref:Uncharacterized protein n=1 Tax=Oopsacas minuta TaxID=111878 RepID=A0AAV7JZ27_9METZ|nr:hypothetical protein LOD99_2986 [Oopsacas minuta]
MKSIFSFFIALTYIAIVTSLNPSKVLEWSEQRHIEDFVLNELTNEVYVAATFLYHIDDTMVTKSKFESNELTATNVIVSPDIKTGFACSIKTGYCFIFNITDVSQKNRFTGSGFIDNSHATFPNNDMEILPVTIRGSNSICFVIADERTGAITYRLL